MPGLAIPRTLSLLASLTIGLSIGPSAPASTGNIIRGSTQNLSRGQPAAGDEVVLMRRSELALAAFHQATRKLSLHAQLYRKPLSRIATQPDRPQDLDRLIIVKPFARSRNHNLYGVGYRDDYAIHEKRRSASVGFCLAHHGNRSRAHSSGHRVTSVGSKSDRSTAFIGTIGAGPGSVG